MCWVHSVQDRQKFQRCCSGHNGSLARCRARRPRLPSSSPTPTPPWTPRPWPPPRAPPASRRPSPAPRPAPPTPVAAIRCATCTERPGCRRRASLRPRRPARSWASRPRPSRRCAPCLPAVARGRALSGGGAQEVCYNVTVDDGASAESVLNDPRVAYCLRETFDPSGFGLSSFIEQDAGKSGKVTWILELGPRLNFTTAWSTNAVSILRAAGVHNVPRIEVRRRSSPTPARAAAADTPLAPHRSRAASCSPRMQRLTPIPRPRSPSRCTTK